MVAPPVLSRGHRQVVLAVICLALVLVVAGATMLNVALPDLARSLHATQSQQQWIVDGYAVALAALLLPAGIVIFGVTAAVSAFTTSPAALIGWRILSGAGAALIMPGTLSTITSVFPAEEKARAVAVWSGFAGAGGVLGLVVSGAMLQQFWWGSIFVVTAALAAVAAAATIAVVPATSDPDSPPLDIPGSVLSVLAIGGLVLGVTEGPVRGWLSPLTLTGLIGGAVALVAFVAGGLRVRQPLLDPRLFRERRFAAGTVSIFLQFLAMMGFFFIFLQYLELVRGYGTLKAALAVSAAGFVWLSQLTVASSYWPVLFGMIIAGAGLGLGMTPATNAIVESLPIAKQGLASAVNDTSRELGAAFGIAIVGSAFTAGYRTHIAPSLHQLLAPAASAAKQAPAAAIQVAGRLGPNGPALVHQTRTAFMSGQQQALLIAAVALTIGVAFLLLPGTKPGWLPTPRRPALWRHLAALSSTIALRDK